MSANASLLGMLADKIEAAGKALDGWETISRAGIELDDFCVEHADEIVAALRALSSERTETMQRAELRPSDRPEYIAPDAGGVTAGRDPQLSSDDKRDKVPLYTPDQQRAADYIVERTGGNIGGGEDPVGFLIVSHATIGDNLKDARAVLTELLRLYDWRFELARMDRDGDCPGEMKGLLNQYGREKQAVWKRTREVLAGVPQSATRENVIEECAKVCEQFMPIASASHLQLQRNTLENVARAIRSLKWCQYVKGEKS